MRITATAPLAALLALAGLGLSGCGFLSVPAPPHAATGSASPPAPAAMSSHAGPPTTLIVQAGDSVYSIARRNNVPIRAIIEANNLAPPYVLRRGQQLTIPHPDVYVVKAGDTLYGISRQQAVEVSALVRTNGLTSPFKILVGQKLILPGKAQPDQPSVAAVPPTEVERVELLPPPGASAAATAPSAAPVSTAPASTSPASVSTSPSTIVAQPLPSSGPVSGPALASGPDAKAATTSVPTPSEPLPPAPPTAKTASVGPAATRGPGGASGGRFLWPVKGKIVSGYGPKEGGLFNDGINIAAGQGANVVAADKGVVVYAGNEIRGFGNLVLIKHPNGWMTAYAHNEALLVKRGEEVARGQVIAKAGSTGSVATPQVHFEIRRGSRAVDPTPYMASLSS